MHHQRPAPARTTRHPRLAALADVLCAVTVGVLLAAALVHWASCEGVC